MVPAQHPREELGTLLRATLDCPLCASTDGVSALLSGVSQKDRKPLRVIAFRIRSIRLECRSCGLRFSVDPDNLADVVAEKQQPTPAKIEADAREKAGNNPTAYLPTLMEMQRLAAEFRHRNREKVLAPHRRALQAARPRKGQVRFPKR